MSQQLSSKEQALFRQLVKFHELKQHKKSLKIAEQILKKSPDHADTIAMKALTLNAQGNSDEAFSLAKIALQKNMKSPICWHVYGLLYRTAKNLEEAIKAYRFAQKLDPESQQIQRDLAFLQIQMRDYQGYIDSRKQILQARPAIRQNWSALAVAYHLAGELSSAEELLKTYEGTLTKPPPRNDLEHSEAALYRNTLIAEMGGTQRALDHMETIFKENLDRTAVMEARAKYLLQLGRKEEAETAYRALLDRNPEYRFYYENLEHSIGLDRTRSEDLSRLAELYRSFADKNERWDAPRRIPLDYLKGEEFRAAAGSYLQRMLKKGVPSTFSNVKALYKDHAKLQTIQTLVEGFNSEIKSPTNGTDANGDIPDRFQLARLYFLAQHYNYYLCRDLTKAMAFIDKAIELSPRSVDFHMTKARIVKHSGDVEKAADIMNYARELDLKDRYINTKCAKYQLRDNRNEEALNTLSKFTRNETAGGALGDLHDMQAVWYLTEDGEAYLRQGKFGLALKRLRAISDIFEVWHEDQFDFHHFSFRKGQIRAYVDMLRWEDRLREHPFYSRAAISAVKIYLRLHDNPAHSSLTNGVANLDGLDANERKKALKKAKREQEKREKQEAERRDAEKRNQKTKSTNADGETKKADADPQGKTLLETKTPLDDAVRYLVPLLELSPRNILGQNLGFEVYLRKNKHLLALKCLRAASSIDPENPALHEQLVRFRLALDKQREPPAEKVGEVLKLSLDILPSSSDLKSFNDEYLAKHESSAPHVQSALKARLLIDPSSKAQAERDLISSIELPSATPEQVHDALLLLKNNWKSTSAVVDEALVKARKRWPAATMFKEGRISLV